MAPRARSSDFFTVGFTTGVRHVSRDVVDKGDEVALFFSSTNHLLIATTTAVEYQTRNGSTILFTRFRFFILSRRIDAVVTKPVRRAFDNNKTIFVYGKRTDAI